MKRIIFTAALAALTGACAQPPCPGSDTVRVDLDNTVEPPRLAVVETCWGRDKEQTNVEVIYGDVTLKYNASGVQGTAAQAEALKAMSNTLDKALDKVPEINP